MTVHSKTEKFTYDNGAQIEVTTDSEDEFNAVVTDENGNTTVLNACDIIGLADE